MKNLNYILLFFSLVTFSQKQPKIGLVLSGGGAKGFAHVGVLKEIERANIKLDYIGGTSMGAIIGGLYASGYSADEIEKKIKGINFEELIQDKIPRKDIPLFYKQHLSNHAVFLPVNKNGFIPSGVSKGQNTQNFFTELFSIIDTHSFKDLPIPFFCIATDLETGERIVLQEGDLAKAVRASGAFPTLIQPVKINNRLLVDGGVVDNFPVKELRNKGMDIIIGVDVQDGLFDRKNLNSATAILSQIASYQTYRESEQQKKDIDIYLKPNIKGFNVVSFEQRDTIIKNGEIEAKKFRKVFDSISKLQTHKRVIKKHHKHNEYKKFLIDQIELYGNKQYSYDYVIGTLGINLCDSLSFHDVSEKINRLTATKNFSDIKYELKDVKDGKNLILHLEEVQNKTFLGLGIHYDQIFGLGILTNYTHKKIFAQNDILALDLVFGDNLRYTLNYFIDNGYSLGIGINSSIKIFDHNVRFFGENVNKLNVSFLEFIGRFYIQTKFRKKYALDIGADFRRLKATSETVLYKNNPITYENSNYALSFANLTIDRLDDNIYPRKGIYFNTRFDWIFYSNRNFKSKLFINKDKFEPFAQVRAKFSSVSSLRKWSFQQNYEAGMTLFNKPSDGFAYKIGGYNQNLPNNFVSFYGWDLAKYMRNNYLKGLFSLRYNVKNGHHLLFDTNLIKMGKNNFLKDKLLENIYFGYALGYGFKSILGPIELRATWSKNHNLNVLFNLGFWF